MLQPSLRGAALAVLTVLTHGVLPAQEPEPGTPPRRGPRGAAGRDARPPMAPVVGLRVGTIHTVSDGTIEDGRILMRGRRILAIGPASEVPLPEGAEESSYPEAHAYPGLVDALSDAFAPPSEVGNKSWDAGVDMADGLDPFDKQAQKLAQYGITTTYVANRGEGQWRGMGALLRVGRNGFEHSDLGADAVSLRLTAGPNDAHPLARAGALDAPKATLKQLEGYKKSLEKHEKDLETYAEDYEKWLAHYRGDKKDETAEGKEKETEKGESGGPETPDAGGATPPAGRGPGRRGRRPGGRTPGGPGGGGGEAVALPFAEQDPQPGGPPRGPRGRGRRPQDPEGEKAPEGGDESAEKDEGKKKDEDAPKRPKYPKPVERDPAKDALLEVVDGKRPLRVEAHRVDEIRAVLALGREFEIGRLVLEHASAGDRVADEIARAGVPVVVTELMPGSVPKTYGEVGDDEMAEGALPARLHAAGVAVAIASGSARKSRFLPMAAAWAAGQGLPRDAALRAITLTPAEILGIGDRVGSLRAGKLADVLVTSGPLFESETRVLRVIANGTTAYEAPSR